MAPSLPPVPSPMKEWWKLIRKVVGEGSSARTKRRAAVLPLLLVVPSDRILDTSPTFPLLLVSGAEARIADPVGLHLLICYLPCDH